MHGVVKNAAQFYFRAVFMHLVRNTRVATVS